MDFDKLCKQVFLLNDGIRYAAVLDSTGSVVAGGMRKSMRERFDSAMGRARFAYVERENISILTIYMRDSILLVTLEPNVESHMAMVIADKILELINGKVQK